MSNGDIFEGSFLNDLKEGSGTYFYMARKKRMEGEWVADSCTCGVLSDFDLNDPNQGRPQVFGSSPSKRLPQLGLRNPKGVLNQRMGEIRAERSAVRLKSTPMEEIFDGDDLEQVVACFDLLPHSNDNTVAPDALLSAFGELGIEVGEEELEGAIKELGLQSEQGVTVEDFCRVVCYCLSQ
eukprot:TRINITY_DN1380_c0_g1_i1.p1 TRINITY_DN1380_c0_g1~~TRINITY_DN1380_c0_g1_i1.p1  ORF type:complete len:181 (-),score=44.75 TRINITY_DN1380_c0_g1_i1:188-730(-)